MKVEGSESAECFGSVFEATISASRHLIPQELSPRGWGTEGALSRGPGGGGQDDDGYCWVELLFLIGPYFGSYFLLLLFSIVEVYNTYKLHTGLKCHFHQKYYLLQALTWLVGKTK